jgi:hypothetical protein
MLYVSEVLNLQMIDTTICLVKENTISPSLDLSVFDFMIEIPANMYYQALSRWIKFKNIATSQYTIEEIRVLYREYPTRNLKA